MPAWLAGMKITADRLNKSAPFLAGIGAITSNSSNITSTTEVTIVTTNSFVMTAGRAYKMEFHGYAQQGTASLLDLLYLRLRRTTGSAGIRDFRSVLVANRATSGRNIAVDVETIVTPASTITDSVYLTAAWDTGSSATFLITATPSAPALLVVTDVGLASDYPGIASF